MHLCLKAYILIVMFELSSLSNAKTFYTKPLSTYLRELRKRENLSQRELADWMNAEALKNKDNTGEEPELYVTKHTISYVECGKCDPSDFILGLYSAALGVPLEDILHYDTRFQEKKLRALLAKDPGWAHVLNDIINSAEHGAVPVGTMNLLHPEGPEFYEEEIIEHNRKTFEALDRLPPKAQIVELSNIDVFEYEEFSDKHMVTATVTCSNRTYGNLTWLEDKYPGDWVPAEADKLPYMPTVVAAVFDCNIDDIMTQLVEADGRYKAVQIYGNGYITYFNEDGLQD